MLDIPIDLSTATLPVPVQIALVLAATIAVLAIPAWLLLGRVHNSAQTPAELRDVRMVRRFLLYLVPFVFAVAVIVSLLFIFLGTWNILRSPPNSAPEQRDGDSARLNYFPSEKDQQASPYGGSGSVADGSD